MRVVGTLLRILGVIWFTFAGLRVIAAMVGAVEQAQVVFGLLGLALGFGTYKLGTRLQRKTKPVETKSISRSQFSSTQAPEVSQQQPPTSPDAEREASEDLWACALAEFEGDSRRRGLWAQAYAESNGNESIAKARYLRLRHDELHAAQKHHLKQARHAAYLSTLTDYERTQAEIPKGICPNCDTTIPLASTECPHCEALFGASSAWTIKSLGKT